MATVKYGTDTLNHISIQGLQDKSNLKDNEVNIRCKIQLPATNDLKILLQEPYQQFTIINNSKDYVFEIIGSPIFKSDVIEIELTSTLYSILKSNLSTLLVDNNSGNNYNVSEYNPISAVKELLDIANIEYDDYSFGIVENFMTTNNIKMDIAYIKEFMDTTLMTFLNEIVQRVGCKLYLDIVNEKIGIYLYINDITDITFEDNIFDMTNVNTAQLKESLTTDFFNDFNIGVYPILSARSIHEYNYQIEFLDGTDYFHESLFTSQNKSAGTVATLKYDWLSNGIFYASGSEGFLTGLSQLYSTDLEQETLDKIELSKLIYGKTNTYKDTKLNSKSGVIRQTDLSGCFKVGNQIIKRMYKKRKTFEFVYPIETYREVGDYVKFNNVNCVVVNKEFESDLISSRYILEEVLI